MGKLNLEAIPASAVGLTLHRITGERLVSCETVVFVKGRSAVETVLRRAAIAGRVIVGETGDYFADVVTDSDGSWEETVGLDAASYRALKTKWMRRKVQA